MDMRSNSTLYAMPGSAGGLLAGGGMTAADVPVVDQAALDGAFAALRTFDAGQDIKVVKPIDDAAVVAHGDAAVRKDLETRLTAILATDAPRIAKDYVCRKLMIVGTAASVPALANLLADKELSHMSRYALERIPALEAAQALRDALPKVSGALRVGVIGSLGVRRDAASVAALAALLGDADKSVACAAASRSAILATPRRRMSWSIRQKAFPKARRKPWPTPRWSVPSDCWPTARSRRRCKSIRHSPAKGSRSRFVWRPCADYCRPAAKRSK